MAVSLIVPGPGPRPPAPGPGPCPRASTSRTVHVDLVGSPSRPPDPGACHHPAFHVPRFRRDGRRGRPGGTRTGDARRPRAVDLRRPLRQGRGIVFLARRLEGDLPGGRAGSRGRDPGRLLRDVRRGHRPRRGRPDEIAREHPPDLSCRDRQHLRLVPSGRSEHRDLRHHARARPPTRPPPDTRGGAVDIGGSSPPR